MLPLHMQFGVIVSDYNFRGHKSTTMSETAGRVFSPTDKDEQEPGTSVYKSKYCRRFTD